MPAKDRLEWVLVGAAATAWLLIAGSGRDEAATAGLSAPLARAGPPPRAASGPGVGVSSPSQIPARGWREIVKRVLHKFSDDRVLADAAGVTFYALLAIFPALAALVSIYGLFASPSVIEQDLGALSGVLPGGGMDILSDQLHRLASSNNASLGVGLAVGLVISLWTANSGVKALFDALNVVYEEHETRGFVRLTLISLAFTIGGLVFILLALGAVVVLPAVLGFLELGGSTDLLLRLARWPVLLLAVGVVLALVYRYGPSRPKPRWRWVTWGSAFAAVTWVIVSVLFSWYVANFGSYNKTYGTLGGAIGFMTWIWLSTTVVLVGAELNKETERQAEPASDIRVKSDRTSSR